MRSGLPKPACCESALLADAIARATRLRTLATANVRRIPAATASGSAVNILLVADPSVNTAPIMEAPVIRPRFRARLSMPEMTPYGCRFGASVATRLRSGCLHAIIQRFANRRGRIISFLSDTKPRSVQAVSLTFARVAETAYFLSPATHENRPRRCYCCAYANT